MLLHAFCLSFFLKQFWDKCVLRFLTHKRYCGCGKVGNDKVGCGGCYRVRITYHEDVFSPSSLEKINWSRVHSRTTCVCSGGWKYFYRIRIKFRSDLWIYDLEVKIVRVEMWRKLKLVCSKVLEIAMQSDLKLRLTDLEKRTIIIPDSIIQCFSKSKSSHRIIINLIEFVSCEPWTKVQHEVWLWNFKRLGTDQ